MSHSNKIWSGQWRWQWYWLFWNQGKDTFSKVREYRNIN